MKKNACIQMHFNKAAGLLYVGTVSEEYKYLVVKNSLVEEKLNQQLGEDLNFIYNNKGFHPGLFDNNTEFSDVQKVDVFPGVKSQVNQIKSSKRKPGLNSSDEALSKKFVGNDIPVFQNKTEEVAVVRVIPSSVEVPKRRFG